MGRPFGLSKSRITLFEQCPKRLWLSVHRPVLASESAGIRMAFADGHRVGDFACRLRPDGVMISEEGGLGRASEETRKLLDDGWDKPIFEATFAHEGVLVRVDILEPREGAWHVAEVKNTTGVKAYHIGDIATQLWVMRGAGVPVTSSAIRHLDRTFTLTREGDYAGLFADTMVTSLTEPLVAGRSQVVEAARVTLAGEEPDIAPGAQCTTPFPCSFSDYCTRDLPEPAAWPVALLPGNAGKTLARRWLEQGIDDLTLVPPGSIANDRLARIHAATLSGEAYRNTAAIRAEVEQWVFPHIFLDFETIQFAIPRWLGTQPFAQVPFQFSAHVRDHSGTTTHTGFLAADGGDPRRACAEALAALPGEGSVIAWNMAFERGCLLGLAARFPDVAEALTSLANRLVDLLPVVRRHYYHRDMRGSFSIKAVLPTLAPIGYGDLDEVQSGIDAQVAYVEAIAPDTSPQRAAALRHALHAYCQRDTEAMMIILDALTGGEQGG